MTNQNPESLIKAHQYLYYCLGTPVLSDYEYDKLCRDLDINGKGGSDLESSYTAEEKQLALDLLKR